MQNFLLIIVEMPDPGFSTIDPDASSRWFSFVKDATMISELPKGLSRLSKNVWLLPADNSDQFSNLLKDVIAKNQLMYTSYLISGDITTLNYPKLIKGMNIE